MKKLLFIPAFLFLFSGFVACSGSDDPEPDKGALVLNADKLEITANGGDQAKFTVTRNNENITQSAEIWQIGEDGTQEKLESNVFSTKTVGNYKFEARYTVDGDAIVSNQVTISAVETVKSNFYRRLFTQQLTSVYCPNCPMMNQALTELEQTDEWKDRIVRAAFHMNYSGMADPMTIDITTKYMSQYNLDGLPACVLDLIPDSKANNVKQNIIDQMNRVLTEYPAVCGVAIDSKYEGGKVDFTVKVKAAQTTEFRVIALLVEDGITFTQNKEEETHNSTVRYAFAMSLNGDKVGTINAGSEKTKTYSKQLDGSWKPENMRIVVCALNKVGDSFYGNNSATCPIDGSTDYTYIE